MQRSSGTAGKTSCTLHFVTGGWESGRVKFGVPQMYRRKSTFSALCHIKSNRSVFKISQVILLLVKPCQLGYLEISSKALVYDI